MLFGLGITVVIMRSASARVGRCTVSKRNDGDEWKKIKDSLDVVLASNYLPNAANRFSACPNLLHGCQPHWQHEAQLSPFQPYR